MGKEFDWPEPPNKPGIFQLSFNGLNPEWIVPPIDVVEEEGEPPSILHSPQRPKLESLGLKEAVMSEVLAYLEEGENNPIFHPWVVTTRYSPEQAKFLLEDASRWGISIPDVLVNIVEMQTSPGDYRLSCLAQYLVELLGLQDGKVRERDERRKGHTHWFHRLAEEMDLGEFEL